MAADPNLMPAISMPLPRALAFGAGCVRRCAEDLAALGKKRIFFVASRSTHEFAESLCTDLKPAQSWIWDHLAGEPTIANFASALDAAREVLPDAVIGLGGG